MKSSSRTGGRKRAGGWTRIWDELRVGAAVGRVMEVAGPSGAWTWAEDQGLEVRGWS